MKNLKYSHVFTFNEDDNGGEQLVLHTTFHDVDQGKPLSPGAKVEVFATQELILNSYCNSVSLNMQYFFNPTNLRNLANELERTNNAAIIALENVKR